MTTTPDTFRGLTASKVRAELCRRSLYYFVKEFWPVVSQEEPVYNWHIEFLCNEIEQIIRRASCKDEFGRKKPREAKLHDLIINIPPGTTKSTICSVMAPAWAWTVDPSLKMICGSYGESLSLELATKSRDIIRSEKYRKYFPEIVIKGDSDLKANFKNTLGGERKSTSTGAGITGSHAHVIIIDDPMKPADAMSEAKRASANAWFGQTLSTRKISKELTPTILIMQRLHEDDPTGRWLIHPQGIRHICLPGEESEHINPPELREKYVDGLLDPVRLSRKVLDFLRNDPERGLGSYGYAGQIMQQPAPEEGGIIKKAWFKIIDKAPEEITFWHFTIDPAYTKDAGNDPTAIMTYAMHGGNWYISDVKSVRLEFPQLVNYLPELVRNNGYSDLNSLVRIEPKASGLSLIQTLRQETELNVVPWKTSDKDKTARVQLITPKLESGRVFLIKGAWNDGFIGQCIQFPNAKHDDEVDCLASALQHKEVTIS